MNINSAVRTETRKGTRGPIPQPDGPPGRGPPIQRCQNNFEINKPRGPPPRGPQTSGSHHSSLPNRH